MPPVAESVCALIDEVAVAKALSVCAFTLVLTPEIALPSDDDAFVTSVCVASDPLLKPAPVSVRVPALHTSATSVPMLVKLRVL